MPHSNPPTSRKTATLNGLHTVQRQPIPTTPRATRHAGSRGIWKDTRPKPVST